MSSKPTPLDIAIVGRSCLFPGANSVKEYWENTLAGRSQISTVATSRWGINLESAFVLGGYRADHTYCPKGGYVTGFDKIFDAEGFNLPADLIRKLGPVFQWTLHCGRAALKDAGLDVNLGSKGHKSGIVMGNLSYPTDKMTAWAQEFLIKEALPQLKSDIKTDPHNFFMSGLPAELLAQAVGAKGGAYALDAACASSLYAIGHACKALRRGDWDLALAGAVNHSDSLFINFGFCALGALSASGESRPFDDRADGLIPGEGAGFVVLKRLEDACAANDQIYAVIKAASLGNDGRARNLLAPDKDGQVRCMKEAYRLSGISPVEIDYLECHATGTPVGDKTELEAIEEVWADRKGGPVIGSAKAAIGHLVTAAGIAGVLKVLSAIEHKTLPGQINCEQPVALLADSAVTLADTPREWLSENTRKAAVSAFGFGGNNAHILIEEWTPKTQMNLTPPQRSGVSGQVRMQGIGSADGLIRTIHPRGKPAGYSGSIIKTQVKTITKTPLAITGLGLAAAGSDELADVIDQIFVPDPKVKPGRWAELAVKLKGLRFPPADLRAALAQQVLLFETARRAVADCRGQQRAPQKTGVIVGMACDPDTTRYGLRWRLERLAREWNKELKLNLSRTELADWIKVMQDTVIEKLKSEGVVGRMPNILANRLSSHFNYQGPGFTVSAEEVSGLRAIEEAAHLLRAGEVDAMMVASVDMASDKMAVKALSELGVDVNMAADDAAVVMILKRLDDAIADGDRIIAQIDDIFSDSAAATMDDPSEDLLARLCLGTDEAKLLYVDCSAAGNPSLEVVLDSKAHKVNPFAHIGKARVSSGLIGLAVAALSCQLKRIPPSDKNEKLSLPWISAKRREALVYCSSIGSSRYLVRLSESEEDAAYSVVRQPTTLFLLRADSKTALIKKIDELITKAAAAPGLPQLALECFNASATGAYSLSVIVEQKTVLSERFALIKQHLEAGDLAALASLKDVYYGERTAEPGEIAFVYSGATASYPDMGRGLLYAFPELIKKTAADPASLFRIIYPEDGDTSKLQNDFIAQLWAAKFHSGLHTDILTRYFKIMPNAAIGYSSGESNALFNLGIWTNPELMSERLLESDLFSTKLVGPKTTIISSWLKKGLKKKNPVWVYWVLLCEKEAVEKLIADDPFVSITNINSPKEIIIGGEEDSCQKVIDALSVPASLLEYDIAAHCEDVAAVKDAYIEMHTLPCTVNADLRFYSHGVNGSYIPDSDRAAQALFGQLKGCVDLVKTVTQAYEDGVRCFIELGPRDNCRKSIDLILEDRPHLAVACDRLGADDYSQILKVAAELHAYGYNPDLTGIYHDLPAVYSTEKDCFTIKRDSGSIVFNLPAPKTAQAQYMEPAPTLKPIIDIEEARHERFIPKPIPKRAAIASKPPGQTSRPLAQPVQEPHEFVPTAHISSSIAKDVNGYIAAFTASQKQLYSAHQRTIQQLSAAHTDYIRFLDATNQQLARLTNSEPVQIQQPLIMLPETAAKSHVFTQSAQTTATAMLEPAPEPSIPGSVVFEPPEIIKPSAQKPAPSILFDRDDLIHLAKGKISDKFGPKFKAQDDYELQVRMPLPPLLLCDRVISIDGEPGALKPATIVTETTVGEDSWYLVDGRMPAGIMIEAGQADLLLVSYLGVDYLNNLGQRMYRLLGCNIQYHSSLPAKGDVLRYEIKINSFAKQGNILLFYFQYDCHKNGELAITVRDGCAGFFTIEELNESKGVIWEPSEIEFSDSAQEKLPRPLCSKTSLTRDELLAFADGDLAAAFGPGFEITDTHTRTPSIPKGDLLLIDEVEVIDTNATPNYLAYMRSKYQVSPDDWFFAGHFHNDPCMPGTLMFEVCLHNLEIFLAYMGATLKYDGFRFEPIKDTPDKLRCRGQVIPSSNEMIYETYITDYGLEPYPWVKAQVRVSVDGLACLHCSDIGLEMVLDWPLYSSLGSEKLPQDDLPSIYDYRSLLACATGKPSDAFGELWEPMNARRLPRLPGHPYHFMSRVTKVTDCPIAVMKTGGKIEIEYDVPPEAWYFKDNPSGVMPFSILLEVALQPCGWLASYIGSYHDVDEELSFRNLDGVGVVHGEITPDSGIVTTKCEVTSLSAVSGMKIQSFKVEVVCGEKLIYELTTVFGFFPLAALEAQVGIEFSEQERALLDKRSDFTRIDLTKRPAKYFDGPLALPAPQLLMLSQVSAFWPDGGKAGLGFIRAEKLPTYKDWYFKAHFFGDPVQPGSLGLEAMFQLFQFYMIETGIGKDMPDPSFEYIRLNQEHAWKYRGQVIPGKKKVTITAEITEIKMEALHPYVVADCTLWVDGLKIYTATSFAVAVKPGIKTKQQIELPTLELPLMDQDTLLHTRSSLTASKTFSPAQNDWLNDHRPTYLIPTLPLTVMMELICEAAQAFDPTIRVIGLRNTKVSSWMAFPDGEAEVKTELKLLSEENGKRIVSVSLLSYKQRKNNKLSRFEAFFSGEVILAEEYFEVTTEDSSLKPLSEPDGKLVKGEELYTDGIMFHGPALQLLDFIKTGAKNGVSAVIRNENNEKLIGILSPLTLDAVHHAVPINQMELWDKEMEPGFFSFPYGVTELKLFGPLPKAARLRFELRFAGHFEDNPRLLMCRFNLYDGTGDDANIWVSATFIYVSLPQGRLGACATPLLKDFIIHKKMCENVSLARLSDSEAMITLSEVKQQDWLEGSVPRVYLGERELAEYNQLKLDNPAQSLEWLGTRIAAKEFAAFRLKLHPINVTLAEKGAENTLTASSENTPYNQLRLSYSISRDSETVVKVTEIETPLITTLETNEVMPFWRQTINVKGGLLEGLFLSLINTFVGKIHFDDYPAYKKLKGQTCLYLANHQVGVESIIFTLTLSALNDSLIVALNKLENKSGWFGKIIDFCFSYPGIHNPELMLYFNRKKPQELLNLLGNMKEFLSKGNKSLLVHVEGTRMMQSGQDIQKLSSIWMDLALKQNLPIIPLSFRGGLPQKAAESKLEFPVGMGRQDYYLGKPIMPAELKELPLVKRINLVRTAINNLGPGASEQPNPPNEELTYMVGKWSKIAGAHLAMSAILQSMVYANRSSFTALESGIHRIENTFEAIIRAAVTSAANLKARVGFVVPQSIEAKWVGKLTKMAFGSNGPVVLERLPKFKKFDVIIQAGKENL